MTAAGTDFPNQSAADIANKATRKVSQSGGNNKGDVATPRKKFNGCIKGLEGHVYDITGYKSQDLFEKTNKEIVNRWLKKRYLEARGVEKKMLDVEPPRGWLVSAHMRKKRPFVSLHKNLY